MCNLDGDLNEVKINGQFSNLHQNHMCKAAEVVVGCCSSGRRRHRRRHRCRFFPIVNFRSIHLFQCSGELWSRFSLF